MTVRLRCINCSTPLPRLRSPIGRARKQIVCTNSECGMQYDRTFLAEADPLVLYRYRMNRNFILQHDSSGRPIMYLPYGAGLNPKLQKRLNAANSDGSGLNFPQTQPQPQYSVAGERVPPDWHGRERR